MSILKRLEALVVGKANAAALAEIDAAIAHSKKLEEQMQAMRDSRQAMMDDLQNIIRLTQWSDSLPAQEELRRPTVMQQNRVINHFYAKYGLLRVQATRLLDKLNREKL